MTVKPYRPRLIIDVSEEQLRSLQELIKWGNRNEFFCVIVDDVIRLLEKYGEFFIAAVLAKDVKMEDWFKGRGKYGHDRKPE